MSRDATSEALTASQAGHTRPVLFVQLDYDSGAVRANSTDRSLYFAPDGGSPLEEFLGAGNLGSITGIGETAELRATRTEVTLTGIPPAFIALAFENAQGRRGRVWIGLLDDNYAVVAEPILMFEGLLDSPFIKLGSVGTVTVPINNRLILWERASNLLYTDQDQRQLFPGDRGFEFVQQTAEKNLIWGFGGTGQIPQSTGASTSARQNDQGYVPQNAGQAARDAREGVLPSSDPADRRGGGGP